MKYTSRNSILVGIGAILVLALAGMPLQNAEALDSTMLYKLQGIQNEIESLKENSENFDATKIGSNAFKFNSIGEDLLEIKNDAEIDSNDKEAISVALDYLISEYKAAFNEYKSQVDEYEKINSVNMAQKQIMNNLVQDFIDFEAVDEDYNKQSSNNAKISSEIKKVTNEAKFQKYINKIAIKIADSYNGNKIQKTYHEVALQKVAEEENWQLVAPAIDRIITQYDNPKVKQHLEMYKEKALSSIEQLEKSQQKQPGVLSLTNDVDDKSTILGVLFGNENEIFTSSIILAQLKDELNSIISDSQKIVEDENNRIQEYVEFQREQARQNDDDNNVQLEIDSEPEPEPEPENAGIGNTENNPNENASNTAKEKASSEPNEKATENANEKASDSTNDKPNDSTNDKPNDSTNDKADKGPKKTDNKGKGKKA